MNKTLLMYFNSIKFKNRRIRLIKPIGINFLKENISTADENSQVHCNKTVAIIGGGNMGLALACEIYKNTGYKVNIITTHPEDFNGKIKAINSVNKDEFWAHTALVTDNYEDGLKNADMIFITLPAFLFSDLIKKLKLRQKTKICLIPGFGGREFFCQELIHAGHTVFGFNRTPFIARAKVVGKEVLYERNYDVRIATFKHENKHRKKLQQKMQKMLGVKMSILGDFLAITFTPSNPILHTSRLCTMFEDADFNTAFDRNFLFYKEWDNSASEVFINADNEIEELCDFFKKNGVDFSGMVSSKERYNSYNAEDMTKAISNVEALEKIHSPMIKKKDKYFINKNSRYLTEDFPFGLCTLKGFALIAKINTPTIDKILNWYQNISGKEYFIGDAPGKNFKETSAPQNFGITTVNDVLEYYDPFAKIRYFNCGSLKNSLNYAF